MNDEKKLPVWRYTSAIILLLCGQMFLLSSCVDKVSDGPSSGKKVVVRFTLNNNTYGDNEIVTRNLSDMYPETVVFPIGGDLYLYATLEADQGVRLRSNTDPLEENTKVRIVAYPNVGNNIEYADYTYKSGKLEPDANDGVGLELNEGVYTIAAYSYNGNTLPNHHPTTISGIDPSIDLLYCKVESIEITSSANEVTLTLKHLFSRLQLEITTNYLGAFNPSSFGPVTIVPNRKVNLSPVTGQLADNGSNASPIHFSWIGSDVNTKVASNFSTVWTGENNGTEVHFSSFTIGSDHFSGDNLVARFEKKLETGRSYILRVRLRKLQVAKSNIYWNGAELTFEPVDGDVTMEMVQGVMFKWGSLIGISPEIGFSPAYAYVPDYNSGDPQSSTWNNVANPSWTNILYYGYNTDHSYYNMDNPILTNLGVSYYPQYLGDICQYIGETTTNDKLRGYRMFTGREFMSGAWIKTPGSSWMNVSPTAADGKTLMPASLSGHGSKIPASGYRGHPNSDTDANMYPNYIGIEGMYWSSTFGHSNGLSFLFSSEFQTNSLASNHRRFQAFPIRCVKDD